MAPRAAARFQARLAAERAGFPPGLAGSAGLGVAHGGAPGSAWLGGAVSWSAGLPGSGGSGLLCAVMWPISGAWDTITLQCAMCTCMLYIGTFAVSDVGGRGAGCVKLVGGSTEMSF